MTLVAGGQSVALTKEEQDQYNGQALPLSSVEILDISDGSSSNNWTTGFLFLLLHKKYLSMAIYVRDDASSEKMGGT